MHNIGACVPEELLISECRRLALTSSSAPSMATGSRTAAADAQEVMQRLPVIIGGTSGTGAAATGTYAPELLAAGFTAVFRGRLRDYETSATTSAPWRWTSHSRRTAGERPGGHHRLRRPSALLRPCRVRGEPGGRAGGTAEDGVRPTVRHAVRPCGRPPRPGQHRRNPHRGQLHPGRRPGRRAPRGAHRGGARRLPDPRPRPETTRELCQGLGFFAVQVRHGSARPLRILSALLDAGLDATEGGPVTCLAPPALWPSVCQKDRSAQVLASGRSHGEASTANTGRPFAGLGNGIPARARRGRATSIHPWLSLPYRTP